MRVVITGGQGQVARALAANAPSAWEVSTLTRQELDITDARSIHDAMKRNNPSLVVNAAAYTAVDKAETDEEAAFLVNGQGVANLTEICASIDARLVHFSTDFVFNGNQSRPYRRDDKPAPRSVYGKSKLSGELEALKLPANLVIRTAWVYGHSGANFVKTMLRLMGERQEVRVVSDQIGTPTHAQSLARATWSLLMRNECGLHHFTDAGVASWYDFAVAIQEEGRLLGLLDREIPVIPIQTSDYPTPAERPPYSVLDKSETWGLLGQPARHWRVELRDMLAAEMSNHV